MYAFDPRMYPSAQFPQFPQFAGNPNYSFNSYPAQMSGAPVTQGHSFENFYLLSRIEELRAQLAATNEMLQVVLSRLAGGEEMGFQSNAYPRAPGNAWYGRNFAASPYAMNQGNTFNHSAPSDFPYGVVPFQRPGTAGFATQDGGPVRLRESDSHVYCDIFLPNLAISDVEVEAVGNRIVARTRVPVAPMNRWMPVASQLPKGFEFFEMPDGRIECSWLCHSAFQAKDVEATFREGFLCICITKADALNHRHTIKVAKETLNRRAANETHS